jgi:hypothetical protein
MQKSEAGWRELGLYQLNPKRVVLMLINVLDGVWAFGGQPFGLRQRVGVVARRDFNVELACPVVEDMSGTVDDHHARPPVGVFGLSRARRHNDFKHAKSLVL